MAEIYLAAANQLFKQTEPALQATRQGEALANRIDRQGAFVASYPALSSRCRAAFILALRGPIGLRAETGANGTPSFLRGIGQTGKTGFGAIS
jgi:hypothetical protein